MDFSCIVYNSFCHFLILHNPILVDQCAAADVYRGGSHRPSQIGGDKGRHVTDIFQCRRPTQHRRLLKAIVSAMAASFV
jgi:hypothetical protein